MGAIAFSVPTRPETRVLVIVYRLSHETFSRVADVY